MVVVVLVFNWLSLLTCSARWLTEVSHSLTKSTLGIYYTILPTSQTNRNIVHSHYVTPNTKHYTLYLNTTYYMLLTYTPHPSWEGRHSPSQLTETLPQGQHHLNIITNQHQHQHRHHQHNHHHHHYYMAVVGESCSFYFDLNLTSCSPLWLIQFEQHLVTLGRGALSLNCQQ